MNFAHQTSDDTEPPHAEDIMEQSMSIIFDMVIDPMQENLDADDMQTLGIIGVAFKLIAEKAHAYEKIVGEVPSQETPQDFFRN